MAYDYALLDDTEALRAISQAGVSNPRTNDINEALWAASQEINDHLERDIIQKNWVEYHERSPSEPSVLRVKHWPPKSPITEIAEDSSRSYGSSTVLTEGTDFIVDYNTGKITRVSGSSPISWSSGFEAIRIKFAGGWLLADVPPRVKAVCGEYMARQYHARVNQSHAFQSVNNETGSVTSFGPIMLTDPMRKRLFDYKDHGASTCVRFELGS